MSKKDQDEQGQAGVQLDRRSLLVGGAAATVAGISPQQAPAHSAAPVTRMSAPAAVYINPEYRKTFRHRYSKGKIVDTQNDVKKLFNNDRSQLRWGAYQMQLEPQDKWGRNPDERKDAYDGWKDFSDEARASLEKLPAKFKDLANVMDPLNPGLVADNMMEHLDGVIRFALWDHAIPIDFDVQRKSKRHHELVTTWIPTPSGDLPAMLKLDMWCPLGGWQGWASWPKTRTPKPITRFEASWRVPPKLKENGQIVFIFTGLESIAKKNRPGGILQPVLQWTDEGWHVRSWYVTSEFDPIDYPDMPGPNDSVPQDKLAKEHRCFSPATVVQEDDLITGIIEGGEVAKDKFSYKCSIKVNGKSMSETDLSVDDIPQPVDAVCAIESYKVRDRKNECPAQVTINSFSLDVEKMPVSPLTWNPGSPRGKDYVTTFDAGTGSIDFKLR